MPTTVCLQISNLTTAPLAPPLASLLHKFNIFSSSSSKMVLFSLLSFFYSLLHNFKISAPPPIDFTSLIFSLPDRPKKAKGRPKRPNSNNLCPENNRRSENNRRRRRKRRGNFKIVEEGKKLRRGKY